MTLDPCIGYFLLALVTIIVLPMILAACRRSERRWYRRQKRNKHDELRDSLFGGKP